MTIISNFTRNRQVYFASLILAIYLGIFFVMVAVSVIHARVNFGQGFFSEFLIFSFLYQLEIIYVFVEIALAIFTMLWMARSVSNLNRIGVRTRYGPLSAGLGWLVPFVNFVRPYKVMGEIIAKHEAMVDKFRSTRPDHIFQSDRMSRLRGLWWGLWVFTFPLSFGLSSLLLDLLDLDFITEDYLMEYGLLGKLALDLLLTVIWLRLVRQVGYLEKEVEEIVAAGVVEKYLEQKQKNDAPADPAAESSPPGWYQSPTPNPS